MKEGWTYKKLGDVFVSINNGANIKQIKGASGIPITRIETLSNDMFNRDRMGYSNIDNVSPYTSYVLNEGDILMSHINSMKFLGRAVAYVKKDEETIIHGMNLLRLVPTSDVLSPFMVYQFQTKYFRNQILQISHQSVNQASFNTTNLKGLNVMVPSLSEQQSIVDYLDSTFAKIDAMKANADKALNEAKALFQASLKEMLEPKEGWEEKKLGEICSDIRYGTSTPSHENGEYKYLRMNNITNDGFLDVSHYKTISLPPKELEKCLVKKGDIIFNRTNSRELVGKSCVFTEDENMVIAGYLIRIRLKDGFEPQFITYSMNLQRSLGLFQHLIVGAVHQANISANNIQKVIINYPLLSEQQTIVATLDALKTKVDRLQENYDKISQECDALKQAI